MKIRKWIAAPSVLFIALLGISLGACAQIRVAGAPPPSIHTFSTEDIASTGFFYVGGQYVGAPGKEVMDGAEYVEVMVPKKIRHPYPIVFFHGAGQTGTDWLQTPDGRPGWAYFFIKRGYTVYMVDFPARGRSTYNPDADGDGALTIRTALQLEQIWTDIGAQGNWPQAKKHTQWPGDGPNKGKMGDPIFDYFAKTDSQSPTGKDMEELSAKDIVELVDLIHEPVILLLHSGVSPSGWLVADARPKLVKGIIAAEPIAPPIENAERGATGPGRLWGLTNMPMTYDPPVKDAAELHPVRQDKADGPDLIPCWVQKEPAHKLVNLEGIPVLNVSGEASYHRPYAHCVAKWLNQAGVKTTFVKLEDVGIRGNGHQFMSEKNSAEISKFFMDWLEKNVP